jgi:type III secretion system (T3SS) SseB-like protein
LAFVPENPLEEALLRARTDPLSRPAFYRLLMESELVVMGRAEGEAQDRFIIPTLRFNGREYLPVFTTTARLEDFAPGRECFAKPARTVFEAARGANFVLNPNSECGKTLMAVELAFWLDPSARARRNLQAAQIRLAPPAQQPRMLIDALRILFRNRSGVASAHLLEATSRLGQEPPHPVIGIATENYIKISGEVSELAAALSPETIIDVVEIADPPEGIAATLAAVPPFYQRTPTN